MDTYVALLRGVETDKLPMKSLTALCEARVRFGTNLHSKRKCSVSRKQEDSGCFCVKAKNADQRAWTGHGDSAYEPELRAVLENNPYLLLWTQNSYTSRSWTMLQPTWSKCILCAKVPSISVTGQGNISIFAKRHGRSKSHCSGSTKFYGRPVPRVTGKPCRNSLAYVKIRLSH